MNMIAKRGPKEVRTVKEVTDTLDMRLTQEAEVFTTGEVKEQGELKPSENSKIVSNEEIVEVSDARSETDVPDIKVIEDSPDEVVEYGKPKFADIRVVGIGGAGCNAVNRMVEDKVAGVSFIAINTDAQALVKVKADKKIYIGSETTTKGLGTGNRWELAEQAANESKDMIRRALEGANMVFITAGMGGGTGTGASPVVANIAKDMGILTIAIVTKPFSFEGAFRKSVAETGITKLREHVDALIVIPNDKLLELPEDITFLDAFKKADEVLKRGVQGITDIITQTGLINTDFADIQSIMKDAGTAWLGIGEATGENRAKEAAQSAISSPLLEHSIDGAKRLLVNVTGGPDLKLKEVNEAVSLVKMVADEEARVIFGAVIDENMQGRIRVTVIATGFTMYNLPSGTDITTERVRSKIFEGLEDIEVNLSSVYEEDVPFALLKSKRK